MFLPRTNSSTSLATLSSLRTTDSHSRPILPGSSIGWSNPTTASSTITASAQVHYSFLASQYRQLSAQKGLGIAAVHAGDESGGGPECSGAHSSKGKGTGSSRTKSKADVGSLFAGSRSRALSTPSKAAPSPTSTSRSTKKVNDHTVRTDTSSNSRSGSLRGYAKERLKAQEAVEDVIAAATDTGRLKWEAKSALLSSSPSLALLLLIRAATLGSVSACISLAALYTTGVSRGFEPPVILIYREPLVALAWVLEAVRLLRRRRERSRELTAMSQSKRTAQRLTQEKDTLDQVVKILALVERLLRTTEVTADLVEGAEEEDIRIPDLHNLQARCHTKNTDAKQSDLAKLVSPSSPQLWPSILEARLWLEAELSFLTETQFPVGDSTNGEPDDESAGSLPSRVQLAKVHVAIIRALALSYSTCKAGLFEDKTISTLQAAWSIDEATDLPDAQLGEVREVMTAAAFLTKKLSEAQSEEGRVRTVQQIGQAFWELLGKTLPESTVPVLDPLASRSVSRKGSQHFLAPPTKSQLESKNSDARGRQRRRSLENLPPLAAEDARAQEQRHQPVLLRIPTSPTRSRGPSTMLDAESTASGAYIAPASASPSQRLRTRTISYAGSSKAQAGALLSAPAAVSSRSTTIGRVARREMPSPSYLHHFGQNTITGDKQLGKRPSSVVSDSPSLLFGDEGLHLSEDMESRKPMAFPLANEATAGGDMQIESPKSTRTRVPSLYGEPSITTQVITTSGTSSSAYGHVGSKGVFDPTATLRETQIRRRRADSYATVATGTSIRTNRAILEVESNRLGAATPEGDDSLVRDTEAEHSLTTPQKGFRMPRFPSMRSLSDSLVPSVLRWEEKENNDLPTPMLTERLERKLAESYAAQQRIASTGNAGRPGLRREDSSQSIMSLFSTTSRRTGLASLRAPSFYPSHANVGPGRGFAPSLGFLPPGRLTTGATLATTVENAEQGPLSRSVKTQLQSSNGNARQQGSEGKSALSTLRALKTDDARRGPASRQTGLRDAVSTAQTSSTSSYLASGTNGKQSVQSNRTPSRAFAGIDPTNRRTYASSNGFTSSGTTTPAPARSPPSPVDSTIKSIPASNSPPSPRSVRFELPTPPSPRPSIPRRRSPRSRTSSSSATPSLRGGGGGGDSSNDLDPALAEAESASRLKTTTGCDLCGVLCVNAPLDRRGRKFCSRECRMEMKEKEKEKGQSTPASTSTSSSSSSAAAAAAATLGNNGGASAGKQRAVSVRSVASSTVTTQASPLISATS